MRATVRLKTAIWRQLVRSDPGKRADTWDWVTGAPEPETPLTWTAIGSQLGYLAKQRRILTLIGIVILTVGHGFLAVDPQSASGRRPSEVLMATAFVAWLGATLYRAMPTANTSHHPAQKLRARRSFDRATTRAPAALLGASLLHQCLGGDYSGALNDVTWISIGACGAALIYYAAAPERCPQGEYRLLRLVALATIPTVVADLWWTFSVFEHLPAAACAVGATAVGTVIVSLGTRAAIPVEQRSRNHPGPTVGIREAA